MEYVTMLEVFLLDEQNRPIAAGTKTYENDPYYFALFLLGPLFIYPFVVVMWVVVLLVAPTLSGGSVLCLLLVCSEISSLILATMRNGQAVERHLAAGGCLLSGEVLGFYEKEISDGSIRRTVLSLHYRFRAPEGDMIAGDQQCRYIKRDDRPPAGTPLAIWYNSPYHTVL
jgi:hypothetical protein